MKLWLALTSLFFISTAFALKTPEGDYRIVAGDTLTEIAESRYGNWVKWKELWSWNKKTIPNPDLIYPGQKLRLETMAYVMSHHDLQLADNTELPQHRSSKNSQEWRLLPTQSWEHYVFKIPSAVDPTGFDRRSRVATRAADKTSLNATISAERIAIHGEIVNARNEYTDIFLGDQIFIRADEQLQVGSTYSVTSGPQEVSSITDGRVGFVYDLMGKLRIVGVRDNLFIATVTGLRQPIERHHLLIPEVETVTLPTAIASTTPLTANILVSPSNIFNAIGEQQTVFLDRGTDDGIQVGMVFRHYLHTDPLTNEEISSKDFIIEAELQVISVKDKFSVAIVLNSRTLLHRDDEVVALTDLADFEKNFGMQTSLQDRPQDKAGQNSLDELDRLDQSEGLGAKEDHELRQLEDWKKPEPSANVQPSDPSEEIKREERPGRRGHVGVGDEPAPNDGSNKVQPAPPATAPQTSPEVAPPPPESAPPAASTAAPTTAVPETAPAPTTAPATTTPAAAPNDAPPLMGEPASSSPKPQIEGTSEMPKTPAPIEDVPPPLPLSN